MTAGVNKSMVSSVIFVVEDSQLCTTLIHTKNFMPDPTSSLVHLTIAVRISRPNVN